MKNTFYTNLFFLSFVLFVLSVGNYYSNKVNERFSKPQNAGIAENQNAKGSAVTFLCGVSVKFSLQIDTEMKEIIDAKFKTNGCGFVIATADFICERIKGQELKQLHGLESIENEFTNEFGEFPIDRKHCSDICFDALQNALAKYRTDQIEEWTGEKALICTCFGVSEERIENLVSLNKLQTVEEVGDVCNAGTGCGSCQPLIQEVLDSGNRERG